jgi:hypothetical protein
MECAAQQIRVAVSPETFSISSTASGGQKTILGFGNTFAFVLILYEYGQ